ncbi:MAG: Phosphoenolpyruvate synthase, partial [uncultured Ramlibacter sp.]
GWNPHHRHRGRDQLLAGPQAVAGRRDAGARAAGAGGGVCVDGLLPRGRGRRAGFPCARIRGLEGLVRQHPRHALHRHLLHQPGRRAVQGLRAHLRGGAALAGDEPGREAPHLAAHHARRRCLALQPVCGARRGGAAPGSARL